MLSENKFAPLSRPILNWFRGWANTYRSQVEIELITNPLKVVDNIWIRVDDSG